MSQYEWSFLQKPAHSPQTEPAGFGHRLTAKEPSGGQRESRWSGILGTSRGGGAGDEALSQAPRVVPGGSDTALPAGSPGLCRDILCYFK